jgi:hypothetical protein
MSDSKKFDRRVKTVRPFQMLTSPTSLSEHWSCLVEDTLQMFAPSSLFHYSPSKNEGS